MKIGAVSLGWGKASLPTVFEQIRARGGECVEINGRPGLHDGLTLNQSTIPQVLQWAENTGLEITAVSGYSDFAQTDPDAIDQEIERLLTACRAASHMGVNIVRAFVGDAKPGKTFEDFRPQIVNAFKRAADEAGQLGITLAIENHGRLINDGPGLAQLLIDVNASNLGITLDTGNFCWAGHSVAEAAQDFEALLPYVRNVHVKDGVWHGEKFELVPAGQGELDLPALMAQLAEEGYRGAVQSEYEGQADFLESTRQSIEYLKAARDKAIK